MKFRDMVAWCVGRVRLESFDLWWSEWVGRKGFAGIYLVPVFTGLSRFWIEACFWNLMIEVGYYDVG